MHLSFPPQKGAIAVGLLLAVCNGSGVEVSHSPEYNLTPNVVVDQINPAIAISESGGHVVWADNASGNGRSRIRGRQLGFPISAPFEAFTINKGSADASNPAIAQFDSGASIVVWVEGDDSKRNVKGRIIGVDGSFKGDVFRLDTNTPVMRSRPKVATNSSGEALVVWTSYGQDGDLKGVYGRLVNENGKKKGSEVRLNSYTQFNQRDPSVASIPGTSDFYAVWVEERASLSGAGKPPVVGLSNTSFDVLLVGASIGGGSKPTVGAETILSDSSLLVGAPELTALDGGSLSVAYCARRAFVTDVDDPLREWGLFTREVDAIGASIGPRVQWNEESKGGAGNVKSLSLGGETVALWERNVAHARDIIGDFGNGSGLLNATELGIQFQLAADTVNSEHLVSVWSGFNSIEAGFDLFARVTSVTDSVLGPDNLFAFSLSPSSVAFSWPALLDPDVLGYRVTVEETGEAFSAESNRLELTGLAPGTQRSATVAAIYASGRVSEESPSASATSWGADGNFDGLPDDWQLDYFGDLQQASIFAFDDFDQDGASNRQEFLAGTDPSDPSDYLRMRIAVNSQGLTELSWNTVPGQLYQAQISSDLRNWDNYQGIRFAVSDEDSILFDSQTLGAYFRIILLR